MRRTAAVLGGDLRQVRLAQLLEQDGWEVSTWGLEQGGGPNGVPLGCALEAQMLILPLPVVRAGSLNLPLTDAVLSTEALWPRLREDQLLLGGMTGDLPLRLLTEFGLTLLDYFDREEVRIANAVPTAEGAIQLAMEETEDTIRGSRCLVLGFGRIGRILAHRLWALGAEVWVSARRSRDLAWIDAMGWHSLRTDRLAGELGRFDLIFNTVPAPVLDAGLLEETGPGCLILELASLPGGMDPDAAERLSRRVIRAGGLPGKVAPLRAAAILRDGIYHILEERGESI